MEFKNNKIKEYKNELHTKFFRSTAKLRSSKHNFLGYYNSIDSIAIAHS